MGHTVPYLHGSFSPVNFPSNRDWTFASFSQQGLSEGYVTCGAEVFPRKVWEAILLMFPLMLSPTNYPDQRYTHSYPRPPLPVRSSDYRGP